MAQTAPGDSSLALLHGVEHVQLPTIVAPGKLSQGPGVRGKSPCRPGGTWPSRSGPPGRDIQRLAGDHLVFAAGRCHRQNRQGAYRRQRLAIPAASACAFKTAACKKRREFDRHLQQESRFALHEREPRLTRTSSARTGFEPASFATAIGHSAQRIAPDVASTPSIWMGPSGGHDPRVAGGAVRHAAGISLGDAREALDAGTETYGSSSGSHGNVALSRRGPVPSSADVETFPAPSGTGSGRNERRVVGHGTRAARSGAGP